MHQSNCYRIFTQLHQLYYYTSKYGLLVAKLLNSIVTGGSSMTPIKTAPPAAERLLTGGALEAHSYTYQLLKTNE